MSNLVLETDRLVLREMTQKDFPALCRMLQDQTVMYAYEHAFTEEEAWSWLRRQQERYHRDGFGLWAMLEKETGAMVGQCGLTWQDVGAGAPVLEVGYLFLRAHWHQGFATEAARACRDWAFSVLRAPRVYSVIRDTNVASQRVAQRNGMAVADRLVKHYRGVEMPHLLYAVDNPAKN